MAGTNLAKRYLPLAAIAALQLAIIVAVPSKAPKQTDLLAGGGDSTGLVDTSGGAGNGSGSGDLAAGGNGGTDGGTTGVGGTNGTTTGGGQSGSNNGGSTTGGGGKTGSSGGSTGTGNAAGTGNGTASTVAGAPVGDTSHCVGAFQFDPKIFATPPPCTGTFTGDNTGATYRGVTKDSILVLDYYGKGDPAVDAVLKAQNAYASIEQRQQEADALADFVNKKYELYGRKIKIQTYQGSCATIPPDNTCLRNEVREMVAKNPFAIFWNTSLSSAFFDEISANKVINLGGWHFTKQYNDARKPYHYDVQVDGSTLARVNADFLCKQIIGYKTRYAGGTPTLNGQDRKLGLISTDDPNNKEALDQLKAGLKSGCGYEAAAEYTYSQDISRAGPQIAALINKFQSAGVTTEVCFCDLVAPEVLMAAQGKTYQYYPEIITTGSGYMDSDAAGQSYDADQYKQAFGLSQIGAQEPVGADAGARVWQATGRTGAPPFTSAGQYQEYVLLLGTMIQSAGPKLTPANVYNALAKLPRSPFSLQTASRSIIGDGAWNDDFRLVQWDPGKPSGYNGKNGTYTNKTPTVRYSDGTFPKTEFLRT